MPSIIQILTSASEVTDCLAPLVMPHISMSVFLPKTTRRCLAAVPIAKAAHCRATAARQGGMTRPFNMFPIPRDDCADNHRGPHSQELACQWVHGLAGGSRARIHAARAARYVQRRRRGERPLAPQPVGRLLP